MLHLEVRGKTGRLSQDNVSEWTDISTCRLLIHYKNPTKLIGLVQSGHQLIDMRLVLAMK